MAENEHGNGGSLKDVSTALKELIGEESGGKQETGFIGRITEVSGDLKTCTVQPLRQFLDNEGNATDYALVQDVPIPLHCQLIIKPYVAPKVYDLPCSLGATNEIKYPDEAGEMPTVDHWQNTGHVHWEKIQAGDLVACMCCGADIDEAVEGNAALEEGAPSINNAVVVGVLEHAGYDLSIY